MEQEEVKALDLGSIDFTPDWAKRDAKVSVGKFKQIEERDERPPRKPMGDRKPFGDRKPMGERKGFDKPRFERKPRFEERPKPLDATAQILPETKALGTIMRKIQADTHAYKLKDLAYFFLDNPQSILFKIVPKGEEKFFQCKACGFASMRQEDIVEHALLAHLGDYYEAREVECEPPKGNFNCVAKCGLSGVLLGPPNIHEFNSVVKEMIRTKYPNMSEEQYRAHIEMVRDADTIEEWRKSATRRVAYFAKPAGEATPALTREQAEGEYRRTILPSMIDSPKQLMITADQALVSPVKPLQWLVKDAIEAERRAPYNMCFALRGAFHHRKFKFFRANDSHGQEFVTNVDLKEFDAEHAIPELASLAKFIAENPCCDKSELPTEPDVIKHLDWLVSTGHVVAFTNGVYSKVEKFPKYGPQWKKRKAKEEPKVETPVEKENKEVKDETAAKLAE